MTPTDETARLRHVVREMARGVTWVPSTDTEITCVVCGADGVDIETKIRTPLHSSVWLGLHSGCMR